MNKKENGSRVGFHSIESILKYNPHKIKKVTLPAKRNDERISSLILKLEKNSINFDLSSKLKQEPEAIISNENELNFKDLKNFISSEVNNPLILILDNVIDPRNLGACIRSAAVIGVELILIFNLSKRQQMVLLIVFFLSFLLLWAELAVGIFGSPLAGS